MARTLVACPYGQGTVSVETCLAHSLTDPLECPYPYSILAAMYGGEPRDTITVTKVVGCLRKAVLMEWEPVAIPPDDLYYAFRGQMFHAIAAAANMPGAIAEQRLYKEIDGVRLSGQPDLIVPQQKKIIDFKTTRRVPREPYSHHVQQVNLYRLLYDGEIAQLEIVYLDMSRVARMSVPLLDLDDWLHPRLHALRDALDGGPLPPVLTDEEETWQCRYCPVATLCQEVEMRDAGLHTSNEEDCHAPATS